MYLFATLAYADQGTEQLVPKQPSMLTSLLPIILIVIVFYFLIIRPQSKKAKEHQAMLSSISKGDEVIAAGGIYGTVTKIEPENNIIYLEIADKVKIKVRQDTVLEIKREQTKITK